jgi:hypothetical protein
MNLIFDTVASLLRGVVKLVLLVFAAVFALSVLLAGLLVVIVLVLRFLVTGRKPAVVTTFARFNQTAQQFRPGFRAGASGGSQTNSADIVDVEAHEVRSVLSAPTPSKTTD